MRRLRERRPASFFRGGELPRLLTMVGMLGVLFLIMQRARDPNTWSWFANDDSIAQKPVDSVAQQPPESIPAEPAAEAAPLPAGPTDTDPEEQEAAREELSAVTDRAPLAADEMPAYWRLWAWQSRQSIADLQKRADKNVTFRDLWNEPDRYRGKLVELRVHLRRTIKVDNVAANDLGVTSLHEVFGWNSGSQPNWFWMVVGELPPGMSSGENIYEEATFIGYFLKLLPYEDREGHTRATPLLIGRLIWHPAPSRPLAASDEWRWTWYLAAGLLALFALRWGLVLWARKRPARAFEETIGSADDRAVESWLSGEEHPPTEDAGNADQESPIDDGDRK